MQQDAMLHILFISGNCSTCFGWYLHPTSGAHKTVFTASGTCQNIRTGKTSQQYLHNYRKPFATTTRPRGS